MPTGDGSHPLDDTVRIEGLVELREGKMIGVLSFERIALRMGALEKEDLDRIRSARRERQWEPVEEVLIELGVLAPELADGVRTAWMHANRAA